jgi:excinuclease ABC subunit C
LTTRSQALQEIQDALDLPDAPLRIECIDVSHLGGTGVVASLVVFEDGAPRRSDYRTFAIKGQDGADDVRAVAEVVGRRFARMLEQSPVRPSAEPEAPGKSRGFAYRPQLLVVDGGPAQAAAAAEAMSELGVEGIAVVGLAKRLEEVWPAGSADPVVLPRGSEGLYLLQRVRDEAHRVAIAYQRKRRTPSVASSVLDDIPGLGPAKRAALLAHFGSVKRIRAADTDALVAVAGIGPALASTIVAALTPPDSSSPRVPAALDTATGEIMDA